MPSVKKLIGVKWSIQEIEMLINSVEENICLWKSIDPTYMNKEYRKQAWTNVGNLLDKTDEHCKNKWNRLREQFSTKLKEVRTAPSGGAAKKPGRWAFWERMQFITDYVKNADTFDNMAVDIVEKEQEDESWSDGRTEGLSEERDGSASSVGNSAKTYITPKKHSSRKRPRGSGNGDADDLLLELKSMNEIDRNDALGSQLLLQAALAPKVLTPDEEFGQFIIVSLQHTDESQRNRFKRVIKNCVTEFAYKVMKELEEYGGYLEA